MGKFPATSVHCILDSSFAYNISQLQSLDAVPISVSCCVFRHYHNITKKFQIQCRNVVSFSDGLPDEGSGIPYFYLTSLDPTAKNAKEDPRASLAISENPIGTCGKSDPESPDCAKITLTGKVCVNITMMLLA